MIRHVLLFGFCITIALGSASVAAHRPFALPVAAHVEENSRDGKGWLESGIVAVPFVQAEASFKSAMSQSGWGFIHAVPLSSGNTHTIYTWRRGTQELTLMLRRLDTNKTAFSWGLDKQNKRTGGLRNENVS